MKTLILFILTFCPLLLLSYSGPGEPGGAGSLAEEQGSAWFLGKNNTIQYCLESDPQRKFDTPKEKVSVLFQKAFKQWHKYIQDKKIVEYHSIEAFTSNLLEIPCNGNEDLKIYLGGENKQIKGLKSKFSRAVAFSYRQSYKNGWSKGLIWLAHSGSAGPGLGLGTLPDYSDSKKLYMILLHEIGHLLGNDHVEDTIMSQDIYRYSARDVPSENVITEIDQGYELVNCIICTKTYQGLFASTHSKKNETKTNDAFSLLMGRLPVGEPTISVTAERKGYITFSSMILHIQDAKEKRDFTIGFYSYELPLLTMFPAVFRVVGGYDSFSRPILQFGEIISNKGESLNVMMKYNYIEDTCDNSFIRIHILHGRKKIDLFRLPLETTQRCSLN